MIAVSTRRGSPMKIIGWIRLGDRAACGGTVAEGESRSKHNGIPYTFKGARMACRNACVIAEGLDHFVLPNGRPVPHHGHRTSGGCPLQSTTNDICGWSNASGKTVPLRFVRDPSGEWVPCDHKSEYDLRFLVKDEKSGNPMPGVRYRVTLDSGVVFEDVTDAGGMTSAIHSANPENATIKVPYYGDASANLDADLGSDACGC